MRKGGKNNREEEPIQKPRPELARRHANKKSSIVSGRTIGEKRERLETKNERAAARKKDKKKATRRVLFTVVGFVVILAAIVFFATSYLREKEPEPVVQITPEPAQEYHPTIDIIDEDSSASKGKITSRMTSYIGQAEQDFKDLSYHPLKAVIPSGSIREVDFYLEGHPGFIKMTIDRDSAVSVEDADRLMRYLNAQGVTEYQYLDVRLPGRAFWK